MKSINKRAISLIEYLLLFIIVIGGFTAMQNIIQRSIHGKWADAGRSFAYGRQYDPQKTIECSFDDVSNEWYDRNCYVYYVHNPPSYCTGGGVTPCSGSATCEECVITSGLCPSSSCNDLNQGAAW